MESDLLKKLKDWRKITAEKENVPSFRVFSNKILAEIAECKPSSKEDLLTIKGIKDRKFEKYGREILALIAAERGETKNIEAEPGKEKLYSVSDYLDQLNEYLESKPARIQGEISSIDDRANYLFFTLKDKTDESVLKCFMWERDYRLYGIELEIGMEIIIAGYPKVYKKNGGLNMQVSVVELVGEGVLKKAYDELKKKLGEEGLFAPEKKKPIPALPQTIGLVTSETGAVINDFLNNLGRYGYKIKFKDTRVEGQIAVADLISSINYFYKQDIDVLVIIRGGGSLESLQAFNNEKLVRKIAGCSKPIICGIGHDKDVPLATLAADLAVSTPTAVAIYLNRTWDEAVSNIAISGKDMIYKYQAALEGKKYQLESARSGFRKYFGKIFQEFKNFSYRLKTSLAQINYTLKNNKKIIDNASLRLSENFNRILKNNCIFLNDIEKRFKLYDPAHQLKLGYSITRINGKVIKSIKQVKVDDLLDVQVEDGKVISKINKIIS